ncbi:MAG: hypothetical protein HRU18_08995 [Pseudoalteromonas sp.]|uniref:phage tail tube protein n=1 Tax=Pseudoalteromonas sp. TaxID=53249 RepID=UPI001D890E21|nr:hypothetical protein [Pseudoalteromonas sp.]NRA78334.1 hypothetical protein [Pseudoalteromonas sp.]
MAGYLLRGNVFIQAVNSAGAAIANEPVHGPINAEMLEFTPNSEQINRTSNNKKTHGKSLSTVTTSSPSTVKLKFDEITTDTIAAMLGSEATVLNTGAANVSDADLTLSAGGGWTEIGHKQIVSDGLAVTFATETLKEGIDFELNYALGLIRPTTTGKAKDGGAAKITYTALARTGVEIKGGKVVHPKWRIVLEGENVDNGAKVNFEIPYASLQSTTALNLVQNEFLSPEFEGTANVPQGKEIDFVYEEVTTS